MAPPSRAHALVIYRDIKYPRLEFRTGELVLVLPDGRDADAVLSKHQKWIDEKRAFIHECIKEMDGKQLVYRPHEKFKQLVVFFVERAAGDLGVQVNKIYFRRMKTKWASFSPKGNLTVNKLLMFVPAGLMRYVIFHETAHALEKRHNERFRRLLFSRFGNYPALEKQLFAYWFLIAQLEAARGGDLEATYEPHEPEPSVAAAANPMFEPL